MNFKVLLVDDEAEFVSYVYKRLKARGLDVGTAHDGESAIGYIKENAVDVMVLDMLMPGMDGLQTLQEVKKLRPQVQVVMLTGHGTIDTAVEGMKYGAADYLLKPCDIEALIEAINSAHDKKPK